MKNLIMRGHTLFSKGTGAVGIVKETDITDKVYKRLKEMLKDSYDFMNVDKSISDVNDRTKYINDRNFDVSYELHCNSHNDKNSNGFECCVYPNGSANVEAEKICEIFCDYTGMRNRGVKPRSDLGILKYTKSIVIIIELGFITNEGDVKRMNVENMSRALYKCFTGNEYIGVKNKHYRVQVGYFGSLDNAKDLQSKLTKDGYPSIIKEE